MKQMFLKGFMVITGLSVLLQFMNYMFFNEPLTMGYYADYLAFIYLMGVAE